MRLGLICASTFCRFLWLGGCFLTFLCFLIYFLLLAGFFLNFESIFHHCSLFFLALFVVFWHLEQLFCTWNQFFREMDTKKKKEMQKNAEKSKQVSRPGLYKRILFVQERPNIQQVRIRLLGLLFVFTCYCLDTWQAWSNATKRHQKEMTFADAVQWTALTRMAHAV